MEAQGPARVLVVDDDAGVRFTLKEILTSEGLAVETAADGVEALECMARVPFPLVVADLRMPRLDGMGLLTRLRADSPTTKVVVITAHGSERQAVEAMKIGAYDYFRKPFDNDELLAVVRRALDGLRLAEENERLAGELALSRCMVFGSEPMSRLAVLVARVAPRDTTVLISGESGTGKERVAEAIVRASTRADRPYVRFNCAALSAELAEAELFGHAKGAFTGAHRSRRGLFREAHEGTLLLDEIGELTLPTQAKLLRVLQEGEVRAVGEEQPRRVDVRIIAATHRNLAELVTQGRFREDLYYRLNVVMLRVPPLRERPADVPKLARHFLARHADRFGLPYLYLSDELCDRLCQYPWPGNVRELENALESLVVLSPPGELDLTLLPTLPLARHQGEGPMLGTLPQHPVRPAGLTLKQRLDAHERGIIVEALREAAGNRSAAAARLGISRVTLHDKIRKYALARLGEDGRDG